MYSKQLSGALALAFALSAGMTSAAKVESCARCHGTDGNASSGLYPNLAGQTKDYLIAQIKAFRDGKRVNAMMSPLVRVLTDDDINDLSEYFASQTMNRGSFKPDPALAAEGKKIADAAQCVACHQAGFKGLGEFPRLAKQKAPYLIKQLKDYRDGTRVNEVMGPTAKDLTDAQIEALGHYLGGL